MPTIKSYLFYITLFLSVSLLVSCDDDEDTNLSRSELLTAGEWRGDKVLAGGIDVSNRAEFKNALLDIETLRLRFEEDGDYTATYTDGSGQEQRVAGEWELSEDEKILRFNLFNDNELEIDKLTGSELDLTSEVDYNGSNVTVEVQLER